MEWNEWETLHHTVILYNTPFLKIQWFTKIFSAYRKLNKGHNLTQPSQSTMETIWKTLPNLSRYEFGSNGDIRNVKDDNMFHVNGRERLNNQCNLKDDDGKIIRKTIHRVVLDLFGPGDKKTTTRVLHKDGNAFNNSIDNLVYVDEAVTDTGEIWKPVPCDPLFEASTKGNLRNTRLGNSFAGSENLQGYLTTAMHGKRVSVHVIVALTFIPNPENKPHVTHLNRIKTDNRVENLAWMTLKEIKAPKQDSAVPVKVAPLQEIVRKGSHPILMLDVETNDVVQRFEVARLAADWIFRNVHHREASLVDLEREGESIRSKLRRNKTFVEHGFLWVDEPKEPSVPLQKVDLIVPEIPPVVHKSMNKPILMIDLKTQAVVERFEFARLAATWIYVNVYKTKATPDDLRREKDSLRDKLRRNTTVVEHGYLWMDEPDMPAEPNPEPELVKDPQVERDVVVEEFRPGSKPILMMYAETRGVAERFGFARLAAEWVYANVYKKSSTADDIRRESDSLRDKLRIKKSFIYHGFLWEEEPTALPLREKPAEAHKKKLAENPEPTPKKVKPSKHLNGRAILKMDCERSVLETFSCARVAATWMFQEEHGRDPDDYEVERVSENLRETLRRTPTISRHGFLWEFKAPPEEIKDGEEWKELNAQYAISSLGRLKTPTGIKETFNSDNSYYVFKLSDADGAKTKKIHRLVAEAFHPNPEGKTDVNHINGNKLDNRAVNLEWTTHKENMAHATETGLKKQMRVVQYDLEGKELARFKSTSDAAQKLGLTKTQVFNVCSGRSKQTNGFVFAYC